MPFHPRFLPELHYAYLLGVLAFGGLFSAPAKALVVRKLAPGRDFKRLLSFFFPLTYLSMAVWVVLWAALRRGMGGQPVANVAAIHPVAFQIALALAYLLARSLIEAPAYHWVLEKASPDKGRITGRALRLSLGMQAVCLLVVLAPILVNACIPIRSGSYPGIDRHALMRANRDTSFTANGDHVYHYVSNGKLWRMRLDGGEKEHVCDVGSGQPLSLAWHDGEDGAHRNLVLSSPGHGGQGEYRETREIVDRQPFTPPSEELAEERGRIWVHLDHHGKRMRFQGYSKSPGGFGPLVDFIRAGDGRGTLLLCWRKGSGNAPTEESPLEWKERASEVLGAPNPFWWTYFKEDSVRVLPNAEIIAETTDGAVVLFSFSQNRMALLPPCDAFAVFDPTPGRLG